MRVSDRSTALQRLDTALAACAAARELLIHQIETGEELLTRIDSEQARRGDPYMGSESWLAARDERRAEATRKQQFLHESLNDIEAEHGRLLVLRERLQMQVETAALRRQIAGARRSAAEARYDAGESLLDPGDAALLDTAEHQALEAAARADAVEQMLARWSRVDDW